MITFDDCDLVITKNLGISEIIDFIDTDGLNTLCVSGNKNKFHRYVKLCNSNDVLKTIQDNLFRVDIIFLSHYFTKNLQSCIRSITNVPIVWISEKDFYKKDDFINRYEITNIGSIDFNKVMSNDFDFGSTKGIRNMNTNNCISFSEMKKSTIRDKKIEILLNILK